MTTKTYNRRDSATTVLRKMGIKACDYNAFITEVDGKFECDLAKAEAHLKPKQIKAPAKKKETKSSGISQVARQLILDGKTNPEVWSVLKAEFNLDDSKKHYPTWYRCELKRKGLLTA